MAEECSVTLVTYCALPATPNSDVLTLIKIEMRSPKCNGSVTVAVIAPMQLPSHWTLGAEHL
jgi:hypothetical protein